MSAIFHAYNDWLAEFCSTDPARLKGIAMIDLDDVDDGLSELERAARLGLSGAMITEYPAVHCQAARRIGLRPRDRTAAASAPQIG